MIYLKPPFDGPDDDDDDEDSYDEVYEGMPI